MKHLHISRNIPATASTEVRRAVDDTDSKIGKFKMEVGSYGP